MSRPEERPDPSESPGEWVDPYRPPDEQDPEGERATDAQPGQPRSRPFGAPGPSGSSRRPAQGRPSRPGRGVLTLAVAGLLLMPLWPVGLTLSVAAVLWATWLRRQSRRGGEQVPGTTAALAVGVTGIAVPLALVVTFFPELRDGYLCMQGAQTKIAQDECTTALENALLRKVGAR